MAAKILSPPVPGITILLGHIEDKKSNKIISDIRAGWQGKFFLAAVVLQNSLHYLTCRSSQTGPSVFLFAILFCLFTYA